MSDAREDKFPDLKATLDSVQSIQDGGAKDLCAKMAQSRFLRTLQDCMGLPSGYRIEADNERVPPALLVRDEIGQIKRVLSRRDMMLMLNDESFMRRYQEVNGGETCVTITAC